MDLIFLHGLEVETIIGVYDWEREVRQRVIIDLDMAWDTRPAAATDDIERALNYKEVANRVSDLVSESRCLLVETLADRVATLLLEELRIPWVRVRINKRGAISKATDVGVVIERGEVQP